jgi:hypothetical protein
MISTETISQSITIVHATMILAEPSIGARALGILAGGEQVRSLLATKGFRLVQCHDGRQGYVPAALCAPLALTGADGAATHVIQPVSLYHNPSPGSQAAHKWIIPPDEQLLVVGTGGSFVQIQRANGQRGYIPTILADRTPPSQDTIRVRQPVSLYHSPSPGSQYTMLVAPEETLLILGKDDRFVLVQREDGQLGYVPAVLCGQVESDVLLKTGPIDLGWVIVGGSWALINWSGLAALIDASFFIDAPLKPYLGLAALLGIAAALWFASRRRLVARSFTVGLLLCYAFLHLVSGGSWTLWE